MKSTGLLIIITFILWVNTFAQFKVSGTITDQATGEVLPSASVRLENTDLATLTSTDGRYQLTQVPQGKYTLIVSFVGYKTVKQTFTVSKNSTLDISLAPGILLKEEAVITATRVPAKAPATLTHLDNKEIREKNIGLDLPYLLSGIPSAVITSDAGTGIGYTGIRIRGTDMTRINVTVNGIPFNDAESHEVYWVDLPDIASSIDNIEIQRGVGTSSNGASSFGGSINILTSKTQDKPYGELNTSYGSYNSFRTTVNAGSGLINRKFSVDARLSRIKSDGYIDRASADLKSFFISSAYLSKKTMIKLNVFSGKERTYQAWDGVPGDILDTNRTYNVNGMHSDTTGKILFYSDEVDDYLQSNYQLLFNQDLAKNANLNVALHYTHGKGYYEQYRQDADPAAYGLLNPDSISSTDLVTRKWLDNDFYGLTWSLSAEIKKWSLIFGGAWNQYLGDHFGNVIWSQVHLQPQNTDGQWYFNQGDKKEANFYTKALWSLNTQFSFLADIQYRFIDYSIDGYDDDYRDLTQNHGYRFVNPKAGIHYTISRQQSLHLYAGIAHREPNRTNFKDADPGRSPEPEQLFNYELGYEFKKNKYNFALNLYFMDYKDQLVLTGKINNVGAPVMVNVPSSHRAGLELAYGLPLCRWLQWSGNLTLSRNKIKNFTEYTDNWTDGGQISNEIHTSDLSFSPNIVANSILTAILKENTKISLTTKYVGKQYIDNTSSDDRKLDPYLVSDLRVSYSTRKLFFTEVEFSFMVNNLFSELYETNAWVYRYYYEGSYHKLDGFFPQAPRNIMAGLKIRI
jgi:iron complex outermembrane receptor protein